MTGEEKDPPIDEQEYRSDVKVINFGDVRVARGLSRREHSTCDHNSLTYDMRERRIWCKDCERNLDGFDAFLVLVNNFHRAQSGLERIRAEALAARDHNLHLIAAKNIEKYWRGRTMAISCPHCRGGLLPEDFANGIKSATSAEIERQRRKKK